MFNAQLKQGHCFDLAVILNSIPPKDLADLKALRNLSKIADKCEAAIPDLKKSQTGLDLKVNEYRSGSEGMDEETRKAYMKEATPVIQPLVDEVNKEREKGVDIEFSDEQAELLRTSFKKLVADNLKNMRYALEIAEAIGLKE